jgi:low temperature requirement protein LtrA
VPGPSDSGRGAERPSEGSRFARAGREDDDQATTALELFYDLVFVFAITQLSHHLAGGLDARAAGESLLMLLVVWWSWNYTTWVTNELDPDSPVVRLLMVYLMLASLLMAVAIPQAFGPHAALFVGSYLAIQLGRHAFLTFVAGGPGTHERERAGRILIWFGGAGLFWVAGAVADGPTRTALWIVALAIDYGAPLTSFWVPGRTSLDPEAWEVETAHFSERFGLFVIIALGESVVVTGAATSAQPLDLVRLLAFATAFLGSAALWWMYFARVAELAHRELRVADDRTALARDAYTYVHVLLVAGIVLSAVGDELVITHPDAPLGGHATIAVVAGPALYLAAHALFRRRLTGEYNRRRLAGAAVCLAVGAGAHATEAPAVAVSSAILVVLWTVVGSDYLASGRHARDGGTPPGWTEAA